MYLVKCIWYTGGLNGELNVSGTQYTGGLNVSGTQVHTGS